MALCQKKNHMQELTWQIGQQNFSLQSSLKSFAVFNGDTLRNCIIGLHGYGDNALNFSSLANEFPIKDVLWVCPNAPTEVPMSQGGASWFTLFNNPESQMNNSANLIEELIESVMRETGLPPEKIFLLGFSQGAHMALNVHLSKKRKLAGILSLSGFLTGGYKYCAPMSSEITSTPVFLAHGNQDQVLLPVFHYETLELLKKLGFSKIEERMYSCGHTLTAQEVADAVKFIEENR